MVETPEIPRELLDAIDRHTGMIIIGHKNPDADCLNSQLVLGYALEYLGKRVSLVSPGPFDRHEIASYATHFQQEITPDMISDDPLVIVVDCSTQDRIEPFVPQIQGLTVAVIDHHASGTHFGDIRYIVPRAFSVTFLILHLLHALEVPLDEENANRLMFGLATDTGFFRHIPSGRGEVFLALAELSEAGGSPRDIHHMMYGNRPFASRRFLGLLLARTESYHEGRLLMTWETFQEQEEYGEKNRDSETLYAQLLAVEGCEVVIYIRETSPKTCIVGFRASGNSQVDVGVVASSFGGGGHRKASGATIHEDLDIVMDIILEAIEFPAI